MEHITIAGVGDVITGFGDPLALFGNALATLRSADIRFGQCEALYSNRGQHQQQAGEGHSKQAPRMAAAFKSVPFDVVSIASNHSGDYGPEAVEDTAETFRLLGVPTIGGGRDLATARAPVYLTRKGLRVAFLGYASVLLPQSWATDNRAGVAPMRAHTYYEPYEFQPGAPARIVTVPHAADLAHLVDDVRRAKSAADIVNVSLHWGVHFMARPCDYQPVVAHAAIDAGATVVFGHHAHQPQAIELYKGGVVFYSIGNFACYRAARATRKHAHSYCAPSGEYTKREVYNIEPDPGFVFDYKRHFNEGGIALVDIDDHGLRCVAYQPTIMNEAGQPELVTRAQPQFEKSLQYLNWCGKFVSGGVTNLKAQDGRYIAYERNC